MSYLMMIIVLEVLSYFANILYRIYIKISIKLQNKFRSYDENDNNDEEAENVSAMKKWKRRKIKVSLDYYLCHQ